MLAERSGDGRYVPFSFTSGTGPGQWRPDLPLFASDPFAWVARVEPFVLETPSQFRASAPPALTSGAYARDYDEVKALGAVNSPRTPEQEAVAQFFVLSAGELFNRTFRAISEANGLSLVEDARLFAMLNLATADSAINCWSDKAHWSWWRPITAIHEGENDGNDRTIGDAAWTPLLPTPPYPDHVSGYNCIAGAMMHAGKAFFGTDRVEFTLVRAPSTPDVVRHYDRFTDVLVDTIDARILQGIHFRSADAEGARMGRDVACWLDKHFLQPVR
jgi:hypothetical protein